MKDETDKPKTSVAEPRKGEPAASKKLKLKTKFGDWGVPDPPGCYWIVD